MVASILTEAWRVYRERFGLIAAVLVVVWFPTELLNNCLNALILQQGPHGSFRIALFIVNAFGGAIATAAVTFIAFTSHSDRQPTFGSAIEAGIRACWRLWWTRLVSVIAILLGFLLLIIPGVYLMTRLCFADSIAVIERHSGTQAIWRSVDLTENRFWPTFRFGLAVLLCTALPAAAIGHLPALNPVFDHWSINAGGNLVGDVITAFSTVAFVCGYVRFAGNPAGVPRA